MYEAFTCVRVCIYITCILVNLSDNLNSFLDLIFSYNLSKLYTKLKKDIWFCVHIYTLEFHNLKTKYGALTSVRACTYMYV